MKSVRPQKKNSFFKEHVRPLLFIFLIPGFSVWFFPYAEHDTDAAVLPQLEESIRSAPRLPPEQKEKLLEIFRSRPASEIMASDDPQDANLQKPFESMRTRFTIFRWMNRIAWICLATILATLVIVGVSVALSFRSQAAQYYSLRIGWPVLRTSAAIQVVGQGILAVALSFWVTAVFMQSYVPKLVIAMGFIALAAMAALLKAIFTKVENSCEVEGELVSETEAPGLWQRVREMSAKLKIAPPDRIIVGIIPSFFVTEHPVKLSGSVYTGRTLYLSLPMLKVLSVDEADAILGHELAHFHGKDTLWGSKVAPLTSKFVLYLHMLGRGFTSIVGDFMLFFWKLYSLSIRRLSRAREFRADWIGAKLVSPEAAKRALIKVTGYCEYRAKTERSVLEKQKVDKELNLAQLLEQGYPTFLSSFTSEDGAIDQEIPHPFDSHPPLHNRLERLGFNARAALLDAGLHEPVQDSWHQAIATATALEEKLWSDRQEKIQSVHGQNLAWRLLPRNEEELAMVLQYFPKVIFRKKSGAEAILEYDRISMSGWKAPILFREISHATLHDTLTSKQLLIISQRAGEKKATKTKFYPSQFKSDKGDLLTMFRQYYGRHKNAEVASFSLETSAEEAAAQ
jgi:Zn-dependent protease with chaperone function